jgi:hypothetical protein
MKAAEQRMRLDVSDPLNRARVWRILVQRSMRSRFIVRQRVVADHKACRRWATS